MFMRKLSFVTLVILFYVEATQAEVSLENKILGAYFGTLVSDSLCLGSHYEYSAESIKKAYGGKVIDKYYGPGEKNERKHPWNWLG